MDAPTPLGPTPITELSRRMARGDDAAWQVFHREHGPMLFRHLLGCTRGDHALASEALQGAYLRVARHVRVCESEMQWGAWLRLVARSELSDLRRRESRFMRAIRRWWADVTVDASEADGTVMQDALEAGLAGLDAADRALLDAKYFRAESVDAIAARLNVSPKAVESRLTRARAALRRLIHEALDSHD
ncbi:MAG: sigma-70 family RNA polymerase sigma factor [Opitutaceae bacterium]|nr:sigma-70 family RNA polymerase sigma factor [Opitutaceae bacterium]